MFILEKAAEAAGKAGNANTICTTGVGNIIAIVGFVLKIIQWVVPIILIVFGTIDLVKAVIAGKDEEIKKHQQTLFKRAIAAVIVFLVPLLVSIITGLLGTDDWKKCWNQYHNMSINDILDVDHDL